MEISQPRSGWKLFHIDFVREGHGKCQSFPESLQDTIRLATRIQPPCGWLISFALPEQVIRNPIANPPAFRHNTRMSFRYSFWPAALLIVASGLSAPAQDTQRQYLSGHGKDDAVPWKFFCTSGARSGYWTNLSVPSHWDMHGFGTLNYHRDAPSASDETGLYECDFTVPANWSKLRVFLVFEGVMTDTSAKLNGQSVGGTHQGSFYRFKYDVTQWIHAGTSNKLEVEVKKHSADASVNAAERNADYWVFGGIYRPVYLEAVPPDFIEGVAIDARADGSFAMDVFVDGPTNTAETLEAQIVSADGKSVGETFTTRSWAALLSAGRSRTKAELKTKVPSPRTWTAETPNLYGVEVRLKRGDQLIHRYRQRFGFRTMEVRDGDGLYVNGQRVILKGADRHSFWPDSGRCLSEAVHRLDINTMKDMNMNAVRMSHYPPDQEFLDLCDELGLYVLDELAGWHGKYNNDIGRKLVNEMVERDVNHPCILFWDNGNEGGFNTNLDALFVELDPQRRRVLHPWAPFSGVNTAHYLAYDTAQVACEGKAMFYHNGSESVNTNDSAKYIYMPTEFMHGLYDGGAGAGLEDYWKMMSASKVLGGGFIWALTDDAVKRPDTGQMDTAGNQAPDGIVGPYREREGSFNVIKEIWSPIQVTREADGKFTVENHYSFIDANQCRFTWQVRRFRGTNDDEAGFTVVREVDAKAPSIPPGGKGRLDPPPDTRERFGATALTIQDPFGRELWTWVWPMTNAGQDFHVSGAQMVSIGETPETIEVKAGDLVVKFGKKTGWLSEVLRGAQKVSLANGPRLVLTNSFASAASPSGPEAPGAVLTNITFKLNGYTGLVSAQYSGSLKSVKWIVTGTGWLHCEYHYTATGTNDFFGVAFDYPEDYVKGKRWLGDGPYRVWKNRQLGVTFNVWENDYNNTITGHRDWVYPEFKGCFSNVRWLKLDTTEGAITIKPDNIPFVQVLTPEQPPDNLVGKTKVNLPSVGLAFLDGIPAIGTKFKDARGGGPQGQPNVAHGEYSGLVSFYFGELP
jgi:hypothetical protein